MNMLALYLRLMGGASYQTRERLILVSNVDDRLTSQQHTRILKEHQRQNRRDVAAEKDA